MSHPVKSPKKLIEVALPLDAINVAAAREKSIRHGHPQHACTSGGRGGRWRRRGPSSSPSWSTIPSWKWALEHPGEMTPNNMKASWAASRKRLFQNHRRPGDVGEHHQRSGA